MKPLLVFFLLIWPAAGPAQDTGFRLAAPTDAALAGFLAHLLPRYALKHGVRVATVDPDSPAEARLGSDGTPVFAGLGQVWHLSHDGSAPPAQFQDWLLSAIGRRTITAYAPGGEPLFTADLAAREPAPAPVFSGDPVAGERLALSRCGRCHVINDKNRMKGMEATPSFGMLRTLADWQDRFSTFYALNPHPSFTQVRDITPPFDPARPPPIHPLELGSADIEAILAYVATIPPADLGAPIQSQ